MILQALCEYYDRKEQQPEAALAPFGFEEKEIPFVIVLNEAGKFALLADQREIHDGKLKARVFLVPKAKGRSGSKSCEVANCLWDHYGYVVAQPKLEKPDSVPSEHDLEMAVKQHSSFKNLVESLHIALPDDIGVNAVWRFLNSVEEIEKVKRSELWPDVLKIKGCNIGFKLTSRSDLVCQSLPVIDWVRNQPFDPKDTQLGICLVTGESTQVARLHSSVAGVNQKPSPLASINDDAYESYGKSKGFNFPVSIQADFKYTTALNHLLRKSSKTKFRLNDTSYVCWSEKNNSLEVRFSGFFVDRPHDSEKGADAIKALFATLHNGAYTESDGRDRFYVLGLSPNSARISIRFWQVGTVAEFSERLGQWFQDLKIDGVDYYGFAAIKGLIRSMALLGDEKNLSPNLASDISRAVLSGLPLPASVIHAVIRRIRAEPGGAKYPRDDYYRACLIKAYLNRGYRLTHNTHKEITVSLNEEEKRIGYLLGRLFAVLEKLQKDAQGKTNATIRDRYYSSASCTPKSVFCTLIRMSTNHLKKLEKDSWKVNAEKLLDGITKDIRDFPANLDLEQQGLFALGYFHQRQNFYPSKTIQGELS